MDPLAHTLVGAAFAKTRLGHWTPWAAPALVLGANAPDIDAITMLVDGDLALGFRRGWTHGVPALAVLPVALSALLLGLARLTGRPPGEIPDARRLLGICCVAVWTHPALDWLNTYGIRLWMPLDPTWYYGDALFIIDPWVWLLAGIPAFLASSSSLPARLGWAGLAAATSALILVAGADLVPAPARWLWSLALVAAVALRLWAAARRQSERLATVGLAAVALYALAMWGGSRLAARQSEDWLAARGVSVRAIMAGPVPANPFAREIVAAAETRYHFLDLDWLSDPPLRPSRPPADRGSVDPIVATALEAPHVQGLRTWLRFPIYRVERLPGGYRIHIRDARHRGRGIGSATVDLAPDRSLRPPPP